MTTPARPGQFTGATDNAANGGLFTDTLIDGIPDIVGADVLAAETAATNAKASETAAATSETNAATSATNAATSATSASNSATASASSASAAATSASTTAADAATATTKAGEASTSATNAAASQTAAASSATSAASSATSATSSANSATTSATAASNSATSASNAQTAASASASTASTQATNASNAQTAAETAKTAAETAETNAETAETNAASSATAAASSATAAASSATAAGTSETNAANSATASASSATASANSASAAAAIFDDFDDAYLGAKTSDPSVDNDGNALADGALYFNTTDDVIKVYNLANTTWYQLTPTVSNQNNINTVAGISSEVTSVAGNSTNINTVATNIANVNSVGSNISNVNTVAGSNSNITTVANNLTDINSFANTYFISATAPGSPTEGDLWFDTSTDIMKVYNGSSFQSAGSSVNGTANRYSYTATAGQTTFSAVYDPGYIDVYLNGVKLAAADFTASNGSSVVLGAGAAVDDIVDIIAYGTFSLANMNASNLTSGTVPNARVTGSYTGITGTGALNAGSITSGFGAIDNGSSAITTTGTATAGLLNVDNLRLDGNTISSTDTNGNVQIDPAGTGDTVVASGNVGIGDSNPQRTLSVNGLGKFLSSITLGGTASSTDSNAYFVNEGFANNSDSSTVSLGTVGTRPLIFATNSTVRMRILAGGGLTFNGDTAEANALDDYEEGTWTPVDYHGSVSLTVYEAYYTKIGQRVFFEMGINIASNSSSNVLRFSGLPFTSKSGDDNTGGAFIVGTNSGRQDIFVVNRGLATIACSNSSNSDVAFSNYSNKQLKLHGSYITDS